MKQQYKKNNKYTSEHENLNDTLLIELYRISTRTQQLMFEEYFVEHYGKYINGKINTLKKYFNKKYHSDYEEYIFNITDGIDVSEVYMYVLKGIKSYKTNSSMSFKSYITTLIDWDIKKIVNDRKIQREKEENGELVYKEVHLGYDENGEEIINNIGNTFEENENYGNIDLLDQIKEFIDTLGERGKLFADSIFTENDKGNIGLKLRELEDKYGISKERCRQIIEEVRDIIKVKFNIHIEDGKFII